MNLFNQNMIMKKTLYSILMLMAVLVAFTSCEKEEIENTATVAMAGDWYVTVDAVDDAGGLVYEDADLFGMGRIHMLTFNSAANDPKELIVSDLGNFWDFRVKVSCDQDNMTFSNNTTEDNNLVDGYEDVNVAITGGKIMPGVAHLASGVPTDSIVFYVAFSDDPYPEAYGYAKYRVSGFRYSGFTADE